MSSVSLSIVTTIGELRKILEPFADECPLKKDVQIIYELLESNHEASIQLKEVD